MSKHKITKSIFEKDSSSEDSSSEDEAVKKAYLKLKSELNMSSNPKPKKRTYKDEETKNRMAEILRLGREKAKMKKEELKGKRSELAKEYETKSTKVDTHKPNEDKGIRSKKSMESEEPKQKADKIEKVEKVEKVEKAPAFKIIYTGGGNQKFWYS